MRKSKPVIILVAVQLAFLLILTASPFISDALVKCFGEKITFRINDVAEFGIGSNRVHCYLYENALNPDYVNPEYINNYSLRYAKIETDENGIAHIGEACYNKPDGLYLGNIVHNKNYYDSFDYKLPEGFYHPGIDLFPDGWQADSSYSVTADVYILMGKLVPKQLYINGIPIEEFNTKEITG